MRLKASLFKRWFSLLMAAAMIITLIPVTASAADEVKVIYGKVFVFNGSNMPQPLQGANISLGEGVSAVNVVTDENGNYTIEVPCAADQYKITATSLNRYHRILEGSTKYGEETRIVSADAARMAVDFYFVNTDQEIEFYGNIKDAEGAPITGAKIKTWNKEVVSDASGSFNFKGVAHSYVTIEAEGQKTITYEVPLAAYLNKNYYIGAVDMETRPIKSEITGTAYVYSNGMPVTLKGVSVTAKDSAGEIGRAVTGDNGSYKIDVPDNRKTANNQYSVTVVPPSATTRILSEDGTQYGTPTNTVCADSPANFYFVNTSPKQMSLTGFVKGLDGTPIVRAQIWCYDGTYTDAQGHFAYTWPLDISVDNPKGWDVMHPTLTFSATGYVTKNFQVNVNAVECFKNNGSYDIGTVYLIKTNDTGTPFSNKTKNYMTVVPNPVAAGEMTFGNLYFSGASALSNATVVITANQYAAMQAAGVKLYKNGNVQSLGAADIIVSGGTMTLKMASIEKDAQYNLQFAAKAPSADYMNSTFDVVAKISIGNAEYVVGSETVALSHLSLVAPPIVPVGSKEVRFYGRIISADARVDLTIHPTNNPGATIVFKSINYRKTIDGFYYSFDGVDLSACTAGQYTAVAQLVYNGQIIASDIQTFKIENGAIVVTKIELKGQLTDVINNPKLGEYAIATLNSSEANGNSTPMTASVTFNNAQRITGAKIIVESNAGVFTKSAAKVGDNGYTATFNAHEVKGINTGSVYCEITLSASEKYKLLIGKVNFNLDPSGYVFDAKTKAFIEGAEATLWWKNPVNGAWELFPAEKYDQQNPYFTDETGWYEFFVPEGEYRVDVTAEGYKPNSSTNTGYGPIIVLPVRTDVDIPLNAN